MTTRRHLLIALGALAVPLAAVAQQARVPRLGVLTFSNLEPALGFFREGLRELGYVEGKNILIEVRSAEGKSELLLTLAAELIRLKVDILVAWSTPAALAAKQTTSTVPIVISAGDPVGTGLVASLARPGGNITGMALSTRELSAKTLELIREIRPATRSVAVLANETDPFTRFFLEQIQSAGRALGMEIHPVMVRRPEEFDAVFAQWAKSRVGAVIVQPTLPRSRAIDLALKHRLVSGSPSQPFAVDGGLFAYTGNFRDQYRRIAIFVDRILKGAKPAELPLEQPTTFELVVNMKTAKAIGVKIPPSVLFRADQVIE